MGESIGAGLHEVLEGLDELVRDKSMTTEEALSELLAVKECAGDLRQLTRDLERYVAQKMDAHEAQIGGHTVIRHKADKRTNWQHDDLLRIVMDTRHVNPDTGEIESPVETLKAVYAVKGYNARLTALKERNIDPDDFSDVEPGPWKLEIR